MVQAGLQGALLTAIFVFQVSASKIGDFQTFASAKVSSEAVRNDVPFRCLMGDHVPHDLRETRVVSAF